MGRCLGRGLGADPREIEADGYDDGFDVLQCRVGLGAGPALPLTVPLARGDAPYSGDNGTDIALPSTVATRSLWSTKSKSMVKIGLPSTCASAVW